MLRMPEYFDAPWLDGILIGCPDLSKDIALLNLEKGPDLYPYCRLWDAYSEIRVFSAFKVPRLGISGFEISPPSTRAHMFRPWLWV